MTFENLTCTETCRENPDYSRVYTGLECAELLADLYTRKFISGEGITLRTKMFYGLSHHALPVSARYNNGLLYRYDWKESK